MPMASVRAGCALLIGTVAVVSGFASPPDGSIVDVLRATGGFETLLTALDAAGLTETLEGEGSFTLMAPTDDAFASLDEGVLEGLLADEDELRAALLYHVIPETIATADLPIAATVKTTLQGQDSVLIKVVSVYETIGYNYALLRTPSLGIENAVDLRASNGIIHSLEEVVLRPPVPQDTVSTIALQLTGYSHFEFIRISLSIALVHQIHNHPWSPRPRTFFAPTDEAMAAVDPVRLQPYLDDPEKLATFLMYHVATGAFPTTNTPGSIPTYAGINATFVTEDGVPKINGVELLSSDIPAWHGSVVHAIGEVLFPPEDDEK